MNNEHGSFQGLGIAPEILRELERMGFKTPTPIQYKAIPIAAEGKDVIGIAQTGTGKTMAFGIPMLQRLAAAPGRGLILVPTRELALQVRDALGGLAAAFRMKIAVVIGGESMHNQIRELREQPRVIVATPGRLNDHLRQRTVRVDDVKVLVLDEADRMLDMGFLPQIEEVLRLVPRDRQSLLFSATLPASIVKIATNYMRMPVRTEIAPSGTAAEKVSQEIFVVRRDMKSVILGELLKEYQGTVLLFVRTRFAARKVARLIGKLGHMAAEIHADRSQSQRKAAIHGFKSGQYRILVATDIAARGIDVSGIELVINYDLPDDPENYVHRIGRTGRAGLEGHAVSFATPEQGVEVKRIEKMMQAAIPISTHPAVPGEQFDYSAAAQAPRPQQRRGGGGGRGGRGGGHGGGHGGGGGRGRRHR